MKKDPDLYKRFLRALYKGQQYVATHSAAEVAQAIAPAFADTDVAVLEQVVERYRSIGAWSTTPAVDTQSIENLMDVMQEAGELSARPPVEALVDNTLALEVMK